MRQAPHTPPNRSLSLRFRRFGGMLCLLTVFATPLRADEQKPPRSDLDRELQNALQTKQKRESPADLLERAIKQMRDARLRIGSGKTGAETQQLQQQTVKDLTRLIELLQSQPPPQQQSPPNQQQQKQQPKPLPPRPKKGEQQKKPGQQPNDGKNSTDRLEKARKNQLKAETAHKQLLKDIWGHLPEAVREKMRNSFSEDYLPKYAAEVRKYYEELAKRKRSRPGG